MHAGTDEPDCLWLYASDNHYQLIGPMQQLVVMKAAAILGDDRDFILASASSKARRHHVS